MTDQSKPASRPWRRFLRFSVRGMIVLVMVVGGWLGWIVRSVRIEREAVAVVAKAGGEVHFDWEWKDGIALSGGKPRSPKWLVNVFGAEYFGHVDHVSFAAIGRNAKDFREFTAMLEKIRRDLSELGEHVNGEPASFLESATPDEASLIRSVWPLRSVWRPESTGTATIDSGQLIPLLKGLSKLSHLDLRGNDLSGESLAPFSDLTGLSILDLGDTVMTESQFSHMKGLKQLSELYLDSTIISDSDLAMLKALSRLTHLDLKKTQVGDAGLVQLRALRNLNALNLSQTRVTDAGLVHLKVLTNLEALDLGGTRISDAGLANLKGLSNLRSLDVSGTQVTDTGVKEFQQAMPNLTITR